MISGGAGQPTRSNRQIWSIQALRAVAALAVAVAHLQSELARMSAPTLPDGFVIGAAGVDLFFVISGFVIVYSSEKMFGRRSAPLYFFLRRVIRIVPMYYVLTTLMVVFLLWRFDGDLAVSDNSWQSVVASYFFWPFRRAGASGTAPVLAVGWTLNYEMFFYALFATVVWLSRPRAVVSAVASLVILVVLGRWQLVPDPYSILADPIVLEFTYGTLIALVYRSGLRIPAAATIVLCAVAAAAFIWSGIHGLGNHPRWLAWGIPSALLVGGLVLCRRELVTVSAPMRWLLLLGDASYALYLTHGFSLAASRHALGLIGPATGNPLVVLSCALLMMAVCIATAILVHLYFERPLTVALQRRLRRRMEPGMSQPMSARDAGTPVQSSDVKSLA